MSEDLDLYDNAEGSGSLSASKPSPKVRAATAAYKQTSKLEAPPSAVGRTGGLPAAPMPREEAVPPDLPNPLELAVNPIADLDKQLAQLRKNMLKIGLIITYPFKKLYQIVTWPFVKAIAGLNYLADRIAALMVKMTNGFISLITFGFMRRSALPSDLEDALAEVEAVDEEEAFDEAAPAPSPLIPVSWSDMLELNIVFTDNQNTPLYTMKQTRGTGKLGKMEEQMVSEGATYAIQECAVFTTEFPPPAAGPYAGRAITEIMENVEQEDIQAFLRFVKAYPGKYVGKQWKISETFATWLLNNSPAG